MGGQGTAGSTAPSAMCTSYQSWHPEAESITTESKPPPRVNGHNKSQEPMAGKAGGFSENGCRKKIQWKSHTKQWKFKENCDLTIDKTRFLGSY